MDLQKIQLTNFRNYPKLELEFSPHVNVLIGENAQGKTNLLEAIYVLALARSHRTTNDKEMIAFEEEFAKISGTIQRRLGKSKLDLILNKKGKKALVNQLEKARLSQYLGQLNVILFAPEDLALVKGAPTLRRRFIDMEFGQIDSQYLASLSQYRQVLKQKNQYLKMLRQKQAQDELYLDVLSDQLAIYGSQVIFKRQQFLQILEKHAQKTQSEISQAKEELKLVYDCSLKEFSEMTASELTVENLQKALKAEYQKLKNYEIKRGTTLVGPHRDDMRILLNDKNVQIYGSQGQQRTAALALKLAEIDVMYEKTGEYPILLLDDVLSELDSQRQTLLLKTIQGKVQTFLTTPQLTDVAQNLIEEPRIFAIEQGQVTLQQEGFMKTTELELQENKKKVEKEQELNEILGIVPKKE
ncbi:DNA replication/repair protein RecF [Ligilactobacillus ceti]|uniref:DNA replication and repair protein RecF n=1 Tax=Ligilactobacillus ceti DSM 22408 TaxID=1122146 RepID=A0A0R2KIU2_9LACO|nr:DNA replication/repair protein RecF [Ligilactobacillus ceti]KRN89310.1 DNA replication and repair protein RecF [Ligilactobacillus ceti DSM 22408]